MQRASKFSVPASWQVLLSDMGIDVDTALAHAQLPADLFKRESASLLPLEYFRLWAGIEAASGDKQLPLLLSQHLTVESFDPPIFASICSANLNTALKRLKQYKPLIGPMELSVDITNRFTQVTLSCYGHQGQLPHSLSLAEMVFFTQLARLTTRSIITPLAVTLPELPNISQSSQNDYHAYFGCKLKVRSAPSVTFSAEDANKPFLTHNAAMWEFFEAKLNKKLSDVDSGATTSERVRAVLLEALPSGESSIEHAAEHLAMSKRTLQRKLTAEAETFQSLLQSVRAELADYYLLKSSLSLGEIAFLLGFQETNSFIRAYSHWKGSPPGNFREMAH